jgi:predicted GTPase
MADVVVINKIDSATAENVEKLKQIINRVNPSASIVDAESPITVEDSTIISGKKVLVVEDGPTLTHGEMKFGAGVVAAEKFGASELIDPRKYTVGKLSETFDHYPQIGTLLPAMGYGDEQIKDLETTINNTECQGVIIGTPIDLRRIIDIKHPCTRVTYDLQEIGHPTLDEILNPFLK